MERKKGSRRQNAKYRRRAVIGWIVSKLVAIGLVVACVISFVSTQATLLEKRQEQRKNRKNSKNSSKRMILRGIWKRRRLKNSIMPIRMNDAFLIPHATDSEYAKQNRRLRVSGFFVTLFL